MFLTVKTQSDVREIERAKYFLLHGSKDNFSRAMLLHATFDNKNENK